MGISIRAYAKLRGVSDAAVRKAIAAGRISKLADGTIDPKTADREWDSNSDPAQKPAVEAVSSGTGSSYQQSRAIKEAYEARLKKLEFETKSGKLIPISEVQIEAFNAARIVRDRLLNIPDRVIPIIAGKTDIHEMKETLRKELLKSLENLADLFHGSQSE